MKEIYCTEHDVDDTHNVLIMDRNGCYDCYLMEHYNNTETPFMFMFGLLKDQVHSVQEAFEIAVANAPDYYDLFTDPNVDIGKDIMLQ